MDRILVRKLKRSAFEGIKSSARISVDGQLFDPTVLEYKSTFVLEAFDLSGTIGWLPVQRPLMAESYLRARLLSPALAAQALTRLTEHAVEECYRRDAGEIYFLSRHKETLEFAERHKFTALPEGLQVRRLNLQETFPV